LASSSSVPNSTSLFDFLSEEGPLSRFTGTAPQFFLSTTGTFRLLVLWVSWRFAFFPLTFFSLGQKIFLLISSLDALFFLAEFRCLTPGADDTFLALPSPSLVSLGRLGSVSSPGNRRDFYYQMFISICIPLPLLLTTLALISREHHSFACFFSCGIGPSFLNRTAF